MDLKSTGKQKEFNIGCFCVLICKHHRKLLLIT